MSAKINTKLYVCPSSLMSRIVPVGQKRPRFNKNPKMIPIINPEIIIISLYPSKEYV